MHQNLVHVWNKLYTLWKNEIGKLFEQGALSTPSSNMPFLTSCTVEVAFKWDRSTLFLTESMIDKSNLNLNYLLSPN